MTSLPLTGGCQCGSVRYRITGEPVFLSACGCRACQMQSGSAFGMSLRVARSDFEVLTGDLKTFSREGDSGAMVDCVFCPECGVRVWHAPHSAPDHVHFKPGTLDEPFGEGPRYAGYTANIPDWVQVSVTDQSWPGPSPRNARKARTMDQS